MNCEKVRELLSPYFDNECTLEEKQNIEEHLKYCRECRDEHEIIRNISEQTRLLADVELPESFHVDLISKIYKLEAEKKEEASNSKKTKAFYIQPEFSYIAASFVFLVLINVFANLGVNNFTDNKSADEQINYMPEQQQEALMSIDVASLEEDSIDEEEITVGRRMILPQEGTSAIEYDESNDLINEDDAILTKEKTDVAIEDVIQDNLSLKDDYNATTKNLNNILSMVFIVAFPIFLLVLLLRRK